MHLAERVGMWLLTAHAKPGANDDADCLAAFKRALLDSCGGISSAAGSLTGDASEARRLTARYMTALWERENDISWWQANAEYLAQPWFISEYARAQGWLAAPDEGARPEFYVISPEREAALGRVHMSIRRSVDAPVQGEVCVQAAQDELPEALMRALHCAQTGPGVYVRRVREVHGCIVDRAVEAGMGLLEAGYELSVQERALRDRIVEGRFEPMHNYWVYESSRPEVLYIGYPWEARLHDYVRRAGGCWNGRRMEILVCHADALEELALRYDFHFTVEARRRLDAWHAAETRAIVYRNKRKKPGMDAIQDGFVSLLARPIQVPEDLIDE